jgi:hypothetical protein
MFTQLDIAYVVQQICLHKHDPREPHLMVMKRIMCYLQGMPEYDLLLHRTSSLVHDVYSTRHHLCHAATLSAHARPLGATPDGHEAHHVLPSGDARV